MTTELELTKRMYATLCGAASEAVTYLESGMSKEALGKLKQGLEDAEEMYIAFGDSDPETELPRND